MAHTFRKYLSNRGSALFMVLSTMTALLICCMAMYFSVVSSRSTQYAIFNQQQAYQSATSINDALLGGLNDGTLSSFYLAIQGLSVGESITTNSNGFATFDVAGAGAVDEDQLGAYTVTVTRLEDEMVSGALTATYDITITTSVNGVKDVYHSIFHMGGSVPEPTPAPTQVFAATGYVPNDVFLDGGTFMTDAFFDNEQTIVNAYGGKNMKLYGNLSAGGSLLIHGYLIPSGDKPVTYAIRNNYTTDFNSPIDFPNTGARSTVLVGGDMTFNSIGGFSNANVYVLGNMYALANGLQDTNATFYVDGDVYLHKDLSGKANKIYTNGTIYLIDSVITKELFAISGTAASKGPWVDPAPTDTSYMGVSQMTKLLDEKTASNVYYKWIINDNNPTKDAYVKELDESRPSTVVKKTLKFNSNWNTQPVSVCELKYSDAEKGCIIEDVQLDNGNQFQHLAVIIDTGDDEDNIYTIRVKANRDYDGDGVNETFSWYPYDSNPWSSTRVAVLVKGRGSVVIDIPEGVIYQDMDRQMILHYNWFVLAGGKPEAKTIGGYNIDVYNVEAAMQRSGMDVLMTSFVHTDCKSGDGCSYTEGSTTNTCSCGETLKSVKCSVHGALNDFCPSCHPEKSNNHFGECVNHVGRKEIDDYLATHSAVAANMNRDSSGNIIYPTTNIFLVSCSESANIRLGYKANSTDALMQNGFFGYIYAPYMTFKGVDDGAGGGMVRLMGGLCVSDYIIDSSISMVACWPEKLPTDLMGEDCKKDQLAGIAPKSWKISLSHH
ncbi:MAG: hypothetical protein J1F09_01125 [Oscillospiraceae bacterium]|nr:hypothetical protein [Oscillospiraceae bacterium]